MPHPACFRRRLFTPAQLRRSWHVFFFQLPLLPELFLGRAQALGKELTYGTEKLVRDFRIRYIRGCSHWVQQEEPALVNQYLREFISCA